MGLHFTYANHRAATGEGVGWWGGSVGEVLTHERFYLPPPCKWVDSTLN